MDMAVAPNGVCLLVLTMCTNHVASTNRTWYISCVRDELAMVCSLNDFPATLCHWKVSRLGYVISQPHPRTRAGGPDPQYAATERNSWVGRCAVSLRCQISHWLRVTAFGSAWCARNVRIVTQSRRTAPRLDTAGHGWTRLDTAGRG